MTFNETQITKGNYFGQWGKAKRRSIKSACADQNEGSRYFTVG